MRVCSLALFMFALGCGDSSEVNRTSPAPQQQPASKSRVAYGLSGDFGKLDDDYDKHLAELAPAIKFVNNYISDNKKLPSQKTFQSWADESGAHMLIIWDRKHDYAVKHGATSETDYLVGTWMSEWYFYYKSWDGEYIYAQDETNTSFVYDEEE